MGGILTGDNPGTVESVVVAGQRSEGPVAEFCAALRQLQEGCGLDRAELARRLNYSRSQLYQILDGGIRRPPEWDRLVEPLVRACTGDDDRAVAAWHRRHGVLVEVHSELRRRTPRLSPGPVRVVPAQLPADVDAFTGRAGELAELDRLLATGRAPTAVVISAVSGTAGVGKTALALRWAHRVRGDFPDGQLYVNLRGYDPDQPLSAGDALAGLLRALGLAGPDIPLEVDERAAAYRSLLDGRRMLVVLDNAATVEQARPLLPGAGSCLVLVTSRDSLAGLVARHGARRLDLDLLPPEDAVALLRALIGERVESEPDAAVMLGGQCARLPLALRVAAELAAARPAISLAALVAELADEQRRLQLLDAGGDPRTAVRGVLSWSYQHLPADAAQAFRLLGLHPGPDLDPYAAAALTDTSRDQAQDVLDLLARAHLIQPTSPGRYAMHDLLRAYAHHLATSDGPAGRAALTRLFDHYLATAAAAMDILQPASQHRRPRVPAPATPAPPLPDLAAARTWLDAERATLSAACAHTAAHGWLSHTIRLSGTLFCYLEVGGRYPDALSIHTHALHAARHTGDQSAEAHALNNLGPVYEKRGRYLQAVEYHQQARTLFASIGDQAGEASALDNLGIVYRQQGRYEQADDHLQQALTLAREIGDRTVEAYALSDLGILSLRRGRDQQADDHLQPALALVREIDYLAVEAEVLDNLGIAHRRQGRHQQAVEHHQRAVALFREIGGRYCEATALNSLGETYHAVGQFDEARSQHTAALTLAAETDHRYEQARAHHGLAQTHHAAGDPDQARWHWREALTRYTDLGIPEADDVRAHLAALDHPADD
ncbi:MAG: ATP-binding protein, partial [Pseudonocardiaceae bacterium]